MKLQDPHKAQNFLTDYIIVSYEGLCTIAHGHATLTFEGISPTSSLMYKVEVNS